MMHNVISLIVGTACVFEIKMSFVEEVLVTAQGPALCL